MTFSTLAPGNAAATVRASSARSPEYSTSAPVWPTGPLAVVTPAKPWTSSAAPACRARPGTPEALTTRTVTSSGDTVSGDAVGEGDAVAGFFVPPTGRSSRSADQIWSAEAFHCTRFGSGS